MFHHYLFIIQNIPLFHVLGVATCIANESYLLILHGIVIHVSLNCTQCIIVSGEPERRENQKGAISVQCPWR